MVIAWHYVYTAGNFGNTFIQLEQPNREKINKCLDSLNNNTYMIKNFEITWILNS